MLEFSCICKSVKNKLNVMEVTYKDKSFVYHKRCPEHGMEILAVYPMIEYRDRRWFTITQMRMGGKHWINPVLIQTSPDKMRGLVEITLYRPMNSEEIEKYDTIILNE